ncbi:g4469 [Coccomyxa elongata]
MEDVMDDDIFFGLLQANPQIAGKASGLTAPQAAYQMWNGQNEGLHALHGSRHPDTNTIAEASSSHPQGFQGLWSATQNQASPSTNPDRKVSFGYDASNGHRPIPIKSFRQQGTGLVTPTESPQSSEERTMDGPSTRRSNSLQQCNSGSPSNQGSKSFKEVLAERNKQAQRRFRQRQKDKIEELQNKLTVLQAQRTQLTSRSHMLATARQLRKEELRKLRERQAAAVDADEEDLAREFSGAVRLTVHEQQEVTLSPDQIKQMTDRDLARLWSQYVKELAVLLVLAEGPHPPPEVVERMQELVQRELLLLYIRAALTNMSNVKRFIARYKVEEMRMPLGDEGVGMWRTVAQALQLSDSQASETTQLWRSFRAKLSELFASRKEYHNGIAGSMPSGIMGQDFAVQYLRACELMDALKKNLRQEHVLIHDFLSTFYTQTLTPLQMARCVVRSFPWYPDIPAITIWIAAQQGDPEAREQLQKMTPGTQL